MGWKYLGEADSRSQIMHSQNSGFRTLLGEICHSVNSRPLTYRDNDPNHFVITPNDFIKPGYSHSITFGSLEGVHLKIPNRKELIDGLNKREDLLESFKRIYYDEYLLSLREKSADVYQGKWNNSINPGDIVLLKTPNVSRPNWAMGKVEELIYGADGKVRSVRVSKSNKEIALYSISHLYPLELSLDPPDQSENPTDDPSGSASTASTSIRPTRDAARACREKIKNCL